MGNEQNGSASSPYQRKYSTYSTGKFMDGTWQKIHVDDLTRDELLNTIAGGLNDRLSDGSLQKQISAYSISLEDMPDETLRTIIKDYIDDCGAKLEAGK